MLPSVCSVIDHRWRQNVVRTKVAHEAIAEYVTESDVPLWNGRTATWNYLFYTIKKQTTLTFLFQIFLEKPAFADARKQPFDVVFRVMKKTLKMTSAHSCRNVSHQQQFFSELPSPGRSHYTNYWYFLGSNHLQCYTKWSNLIGCYLKMKNFLSCVALILSNKL